MTWRNAIVRLMSLTVFFRNSIAVWMTINELDSFNIQKCMMFLQHVSHSATCSLRYERQGQTRTTPGQAARQLNNMGWVWSTQLLSVVFSDGAKILSRKNLDLHSNLELSNASSTFKYTKNFGSQISCFVRQVAMQDSPSPPTRIRNSLLGGQFVGLQKSWFSTYAFTLSNIPTWVNSYGKWGSSFVLIIFRRASSTSVMFSMSTVCTKGLPTNTSA